MNTIAIRCGIAGVACCLAGTIALTQGQAPPPGDFLKRPRARGTGPSSASPAGANGLGRQLARIHALWTLEGLTSLDAALARALLTDRDPQIRIQAMRASESLYKASAAGKTLAADYRAMTSDVDPSVAIQAMLTMHLLKVPQYEAVIRATAAASTARGVKEIGRQLLQPGRAPHHADRHRAERRAMGRSAGADLPDARRQVAARSRLLVLKVRTDTGDRAESRGVSYSLLRQRSPI